MRYVLAVTAILLLVAASANAITVHANWYNVTPGAGVTVNYDGSPEGTVAGVYVFHNVWTDPDQGWLGEVNGIIPSMQLFCVDIKQNVYSGTWTLANLASAPEDPAPKGVMSANQVTEVKRLFDVCYGPHNHGYQILDTGSGASIQYANASDAAAFQAALWEIVWETDGNTLDVSQGKLSVSGAGWGLTDTNSLGLEANQMIAYMLADTRTDPNLPVINAWVDTSNQDQILISPNGRDIPVPEPLTMAGLGMGICGLVTYIRKRRS